MSNTQQRDLTSSLVKVDNDYYFKSRNVKVFPATYRGSYTTTQSVGVGDAARLIDKMYVFDPESRLNTEANYVNLPGLDKIHESYVVSFEPDDPDTPKIGTLTAVIGGYYFVIKEVNLEEFYTINAQTANIHPKALYIRLNTQVPLKEEAVGSSQTDSNRYTSVLQSWVPGHSDLDKQETVAGISGGGDYFFTGIIIRTENIVDSYGETHLGNEPDVYTSKLSFVTIREEGGNYIPNIKEDSRLPEIYHGSGVSSIRFDSKDGSNIASGEKSFAQGIGVVATGRASHAQGNNTQAINEYSHAEGNATEAIGSASHAEGYDTTARGNHSHAEGHATEASGNYSHSEGQSTRAQGESSHSEGVGTIAGGAKSHAEGSCNSEDTSEDTPRSESDITLGSFGTASHTEGYNTYVDGWTATDYDQGATAGHAEGARTAVYSKYGHAEGYGTRVEIPCDEADRANYKENHRWAVEEWGGHAEGFRKTTQGKYAHAEGANSLASGNYSHAEGAWTVAAHTCSHAGGYYTETGAAYQTVVGRYNSILNDADDEGAFIIGDGTASDNRHNVVEAKNKEVLINEKLTVEADDNFEAAVIDANERSITLDAIDLTVNNTDYYTEASSAINITNPNLTINTQNIDIKYKGGTSETPADPVSRITLKEAGTELYIENISKLSTTAAVSITDVVKVGDSEKATLALGTSGTTISNLAKVDIKSPEINILSATDKQLLSIKYSEGEESSKKSTLTIGSLTKGTVTSGSTGTEVNTTICGDLTVKGLTGTSITKDLVVGGDTNGGNIILFNNETTGGSKLQYKTLYKPSGQTNKAEKTFDIIEIKNCRNEAHNEGGVGTIFGGAGGYTALIAGEGFEEPYGNKIPQKRLIDKNINDPNFEDLYLIADNSVEVITNCDAYTDTTAHPGGEDAKVRRWLYHTNGTLYCPDLTENQYTETSDKLKLDWKEKIENDDYWHFDLTTIGYIKGALKQYCTDNRYKDLIWSKFANKDLFKLQIGGEENTGEVNFITGTTRDSFDASKAATFNFYRVDKTGTPQETVTLIGNDKYTTISNLGFKVTNPLNYGIDVSTESGQIFSVFGPGNTTLFKVNAGGNTRTTSLTINEGKIELNSDGSIKADGQIQANTFNALSDSRLKENIKIFNYEKSILDLPIYTYNFKTTPSKLNIGCIAQELQKLYPELVEENSDGYLAIQETKLVYLLLEEIKQLNNRLKKLETK